MFYAEYCTYGTRTANGRNLLRFATEKERNAWVDADEFKDGNYHREAITRAAATKKYREAFIQSDFPAPNEKWELHDGREWWGISY